MPESAIISVNQGVGGVASAEIPAHFWKFLASAPRASIRDNTVFPENVI